MTDDRDYILQKGEEAERFFKEGYNCAQAVAAAFAQDSGMDTEMLLRLTSSFGGGLGRLREVCGAVSGMCGIAGLLYGYTDPKDGGAKRDHYARIQELAGKFREENGSIICRELLAGIPRNEVSQNSDSSDTGTEPAPSERSPGWYRKRPCGELVRCAAEILAEYMKAHA
ncbi:MAG: C-GCAxxG-C-C family protein [Spirochaetaceae bacterium]|jgi:C_GCAxxG_C_C family probable redox protein|nr:C-GCAxxG-C-C family protein [Spirochaetaceae bacterium]